MNNHQPINLFEYEQTASELMEAAHFDFIAGGATDEISLNRPRRIFDSLMLRPRVLRGAGSPSPATTVLGHEVASPLMIAPATLHTRAHPDGELATARAAGRSGTAMILSSGAGYTLEQVAEAASAPLGFQMFLFKDRDLTLKMVRRAEAVGAAGVCITVDSVVRAKRERNIRNAYSSPPYPNYAGIEVPENTYKWLPDDQAPRGVSALINHEATWREIQWLREQTDLAIVVKGVMTAEDAALGVESGVDGILVSNHGGRQLDTTFAPIEALPEVVRAVGGRCEVYVDGGFRRGTDVLKALALGARAVLIGRPVFWGLTVNGEDGVVDVLKILNEELVAAMAMCGVRTPHEPDPRLVAFGSPLARLTGVAR